MGVLLQLHLEAPALGCLLHGVGYPLPIEKTLHKGKVTAQFVGEPFVWVVLGEYMYVGVESGSSAYHPLQLGHLLRPCAHREYEMLEKRCILGRFLHCEEGDIATRYHLDRLPSKEPLQPDNAVRPHYHEVGSGILSVLLDGVRNGPLLEFTRYP